jgi:hypothetical protein
MTDVVRLDGNYSIVTPQNGTITLDTTGNSGVNSGTGTVVIKGNLTVQGIQSVVSSTNTLISDSIITLNAGQSPSGYAGNNIAQVDNINNVGPDEFRSGFVIDRGYGVAVNSNRAAFLWDDVKQGFFVTVNNVPALTYSGGVRLDVTNLPSPYYINGRPRLDFVGPVGPGGITNNVILSVDHTNTTSDYATYLSASGVDNDIPNKAYVDNIFANAPAVPLANTATMLKKYNSYITISNSALGGAGVIATFIDDYLVMQVEQDTVQMAGLNIVGTSLSTVFTNTNLYLNAIHGDIIVQSAVSYQTPVYTPTATANQVKVYSTSTTGAGGTALLYVNSQGTGELISAKKALIYSIIF